MEGGFLSLSDSSVAFSKMIRFALISPRGLVPNGCWKYIQRMYGTHRASRSAASARNLARGFEEVPVMPVVAHSEGYGPAVHDHDFAAADCGPRHLTRWQQPLNIVKAHGLSASAETLGGMNAVESMLNAIDELGKVRAHHHCISLWTVQ